MKSLENAYLARDKKLMITRGFVVPTYMLDYKSPSSLNLQGEKFVSQEIERIDREIFNQYRSRNDITLKLHSWRFRYSKDSVRIYTRNVEITYEV